MAGLRSWFARMVASGRAVLNRLLAVPLLGRLFALAQHVLRSQTEQRTSLAAAGAAFWVVVAIFPAGIAAVKIFGLVIGPEHAAKLLSSLTTTNKSGLGASLESQLQAAASSTSSTLSIGLIVSVAVSVWGASAGAYSLARAIQMSYALKPQNYIRARLRALVAGFVAILEFGVIASIVSVETIATTKTSGAIGFAVSLFVVLPTILIILVLTILGLYRYAIAKKTGFFRLIPGATISAVSIVLLGVGFAIYLKTFADYDAIYGAIAGIIITMIVVYLAIYIILLCAILNYHLDAGRGVRQMPIDGGAGLGG